MTHVIVRFSTITVPLLLVVITRRDRLGIEIPLADLEARASGAKIFPEESRDACLNAEVGSLLNKVRPFATGFPEVPNNSPDLESAMGARRSGEPFTSILISGWPSSCDQRGRVRASCHGPRRTLGIDP